jgi:hypothetical protein
MAPVFFRKYIYVEPQARDMADNHQSASFTKLTYVSDVSFENFLLPNTHNFVIQNNSFYL